MDPAASSGQPGRSAALMHRFDEDAAPYRMT